LFADVVFFGHLFFPDAALARSLSSIPHTNIMEFSE